MILPFVMISPGWNQLKMDASFMLEPFGLVLRYVRLYWAQVNPGARDI